MSRKKDKREQNREREERPHYLFNTRPRDIFSLHILGQRTDNEF